jgi:hypothetical protein
MVTTNAGPGSTGRLRHALRLAERGYRLHPLVPGDKRPILRGWQSQATTDRDQIERWWTDRPELNIGMVVPSNSIVVDVDTKGAFEMFRERCGEPVTVSARTPRGGWHLHYRSFANGTVLLGDSTSRPLEVKGPASNIVLPNSEVTGSTYSWVLSPWEIEPAPAPPTLLDWIEEGSTTVERPHERHDLSGGTAWIEKGRRNVTLTKMAGSLRRVGLDQETIERTLQEHNRRHCTSALPEDEVAKIAASISRTPQPPPWTDASRYGLELGARLHLDARARMVLIALANGAKDDGTITRGFRRLHEETGLCNDALIGAVARLKEVGALRIVERHPRYGTTYELSRG